MCGPGLNEAWGRFSLLVGVGLPLAKMDPAFKTALVFFSFEAELLVMKTKILCALKAEKVRSLVHYPFFPPSSQQTESP